MAVVETLDVVLGAKTQSFDNSMRDSVRRTDDYTKQFNNMSVTMAAFQPVSASVVTSIQGLINSIPGVSAATQIFAATSLAIAQAFSARQTAGALKVADAVDAIAKRSRNAVKEIKAVRTELTSAAKKADDIIDVDFTVHRGPQNRIGSGTGMIVRNQQPVRNALIPHEVGQTRSIADQIAYNKTIDASLVKTATYNSTWKSVGSTSSIASAAGIAGATAVAATVVVAVAGVAALGVAWHYTAEEMKRIDEVNVSAQKLNMTFRDLSNTRFSFAESTGMDPASIDAAIQKMTVGLAEANTKQSGDLFDKLAASGLNAGKLLQLGPAKALEEISKRTLEMKNPTDQLVLAYELFGRQGVSMIGGLREGPAHMKDMADWADKVRVNLTQGQAEGVDSMNDAWDRLGMVATGVWRQVSAEAAPVFEVIYTNVALGASEFSHYLDYLPAIVDSSVVFAGTLYDAYEATQFLSTTLQNIVTLNWSEVGKDIQSAFTFDTGQKNLEAVQKARYDAANKAGKRDSKNGNVDSVVAGLERQKEKQKELADLQKKTNDDMKKAEEERQRSVRASEATVKKKFDAIRQEIQIQQILGSMTVDQARLQEQSIRERVALHAELREQGMFDFGKIDRLANQEAALKKRNEDRGKAADMSKEFAAPQEKLIDKMRDLESLRQNKLINQDTFNKASRQAYSQSGFENGPRGAVSAQAGSVEAYKMLLEREKGKDSKETEAARIRAAQLSVQQEIAKSLASSPVIRSARA